MIFYNKLVRDKIPEIIKKDGVKCIQHIAKDKNEYLRKLYEKFIEEFEEFKSKPSIEEFADIMEVLEYIAKYYKFDLSEIRTWRF
jgi:predicted house-cleaning noncanonical NTP pyrophosphatase (MazG superfamily)